MVDFLAETKVEEKDISEPSAGGKEPAKEEKKNVFSELTDSIREKRKLLLEKIDKIKELREKLRNLNKISVRALTNKRKRLEFKISTEAITLDKERALMKHIKDLDGEIKRAQERESERSDLFKQIKSLDSEIEQLKNELDEMKLNLIKLREERKKKRAEVRKRKEMKEKKEKHRHPKNEEFVVNLEDIAIVKKE